jgi:hypothetical protein
MKSIWSYWEYSMADSRKRATKHKTPKAAEDPKLRTALAEALSTLRGPTATSQSFVLPVGIYLDTSDENVVQEVKNFWVNALTEEGFEIIADHEVRGSRFITILAKAANRSYQQFKEQVARLSEQAKKFGEKVQKGAAVVILGTTIIVSGPAATHKVPNPPLAAPHQISQTELTPEQSQDAWQQVGKEIQDVAKTAKDVAGGILALIGIIGPHLPAAAKHRRRRKPGKKR